MPGGSHGVRGGGPLPPPPPEPVVGLSVPATPVLPVRRPVVVLLPPAPDDVDAVSPPRKREDWSDEHATNSPAVATETTKRCRGCNRIAPATRTRRGGSARRKVRVACRAEVGLSSLVHASGVALPSEFSRRSRQSRRNDGHLFW